MKTRKFELWSPITGEIYEIFITYYEEHHPNTVQIVIISPDDKMIRINSITKDEFLKFLNELNKWVKKVIGEENGNG